MSGMTLPLRESAPPGKRPPDQNQRRVSGRTIQAQVAYRASAAGRATAHAMVAGKLRHGRLLLLNYCRERARTGSAHAAILRLSQLRLFALEQRVANVANRANLFLLEAQAARAYWRAIRVLCHRHERWQRIYPQATDSLNLLLNTGYSLLGRRSMAAVEAALLLPQLGVLHGETSGSGALAYDLMEGFRHVAVDAVVIPLFSRKRSFRQELDRRDFLRGCARLSARWKERFPYEGRCERLERILLHDAVRLRRAILAGAPWEPHHHYFRHRLRCP